MSGQQGINDILGKQGAVDGSLTPNYHGSALQKVFDEALQPVRRVVDSDTILVTDHFIDVFPDEGAAANVDLTLLAATSYPAGWKCAIVNDTAANYIVTIKNSVGATLKVINPANGFTIYKSGAGFDFAHTKGTQPSVLSVASYGNFNAIAWESLPSGEYIISGTGLQFSNFPPQWVLVPAATYTFLVYLQSDVNAYLRSMLFYSTTDATNNRISQELRQAGGNFGGAVAAGWKPSYNPDSFAVASTATIPVSADATNPSIFTGLAAIQPIIGFEVNATLGAVRNISGTNIGRAVGSLAIQPVKTGGGTTVVEIWSESSADGVTWTLNANSLRTFDVPSDGESFLNAPSFIGSWPNGNYVRFRIATNGVGAITLQQPTVTTNLGAVTGLSVYWTMTRVG